MKLSVFCTDFDGVISNSLIECMCVSYSAYFGCEINNPRELPESYVTYFSNYRYLVRDRGEYFVIIYSWEHKLVDIASHFNWMVEELKLQLTMFKEKFFQKRENIRAKNIDEWINMQPPYEKYITFIKNLHVPTYIITTKDKKSVQLLAERYGLFVQKIGLYAQEDLKEIGGKKGALLDICKKENVVPETVGFIDDHIQHLLDVAGARVCLFHADWGYTNHNREVYPPGIKITTASLLNIDSLINH